MRCARFPIGGGLTRSPARSAGTDYRPWSPGTPLEEPGTPKSVSEQGLVRVAAVLSLLLPGPQLVAYAVLWALMPQEAAPFTSTPPSEATGA